MHVDERSPFAASASVDTSIVWYLSFGDLLTLLLCFFLVLTPTFEKATNNSARKEVLRSESTPSQGAGTPLATLTLAGAGVHGERIPITVSTATEGDDRSMITDLLVAWRAQRERSEVVAHDVKFRLCGLRGGEDLMVGLHQERVGLGKLVREFQVEPFAECDATAWNVQPGRELVAILEVVRV